MCKSPTITEVKVDSVVFPAAVKAPSSDNTFFLAGAGERGLEIHGRFIVFTAIGVYLQDSGAVESLAVKWKGKTADELADSVKFFTDIITGPFEKLTNVTMILPLEGKKYAEKVAENCVSQLKAAGKYGDEETKAVEKFLEAFKDEDFKPGDSVLFTQSAAGGFTISFSKGRSTPEKDASAAVIEEKVVPENGAPAIEIGSKVLGEAVLESIIGKGGVSPTARRNMADRLAEVLAGAAGEE